jgi:hypothetical protein
MSLSLRITSRLMSSCTPALFSASKAMPAVIAPSPITAMACGRALVLAASAMPSAAEIEVDEWAVPKVSYSLSCGAGSPRCRPAGAACHALAAAGQDLVRIGLVAHVPHDAVVRRVEHVVQRDGQLDRAQVGRQVAAGLGDRIEQEAAQLFGQRLQLMAGQAAQVGRVVDGLRSICSYRVGV